MTALSKIAGLKKGSFTHIVDRLQDEGFIARKRDSKDKRNTILELTAKGGLHQQPGHSHKKIL